MSNVNKVLEEQTGGWFNATIATIDELVVCPDVLTNANANTVVLELEPTELNILPVGENITITETPSRTTSGMLYTINGQVEFALQSTDVDTFLAKYLHKKVVLIGVKHFGQQKMYGSKKFPLNFTYQNINGKNLEDGTSVRITVSGKTPQKPVFIND